MLATSVFLLRTFWLWLFFLTNDGYPSLLQTFTQICENWYFLMFQERRRYAVYEALAKQFVYYLLNVNNLVLRKGFPQFLPDFSLLCFLSPEYASMYFNIAFPSSFWFNCFVCRGGFYPSSFFDQRKSLCLSAKQLIACNRVKSSKKKQFRDAPTPLPTFDQKETIPEESDLIFVTLPNLDFM